MKLTALFVLVVFAGATIAAIELRAASPSQLHHAAQASETRLPSTATMTPHQIAEMRADILMARKEYRWRCIAYSGHSQERPEKRAIAQQNRHGLPRAWQLDQRRALLQEGHRRRQELRQRINNLGTLEYERSVTARRSSDTKKALEA